MVSLITGASHTGKTALAQKILEEYGYPYLSIDHLKMGLIRSGYTNLTPEDDDKLTEYLWPIIREIVKTAIENQQNLVIEGCYIPFDWTADFNDFYRKNIRFICLVMSEKYIANHFADIQKFASVIENRLDDSYHTAESAAAENRENWKMCKKYSCDYILIDDSYEVKIPFPPPTSL